MSKVITIRANKQQMESIKRMLLQLPKKIRNKILRQELRAAAKKLVAPSKAATPVRTGKLQKSVKVRAATKRGSVAMRVGYGEKNFTGKTFYGAFLEWGWRVGKRPSKRLAGTELDKRPKIEGREMLGKVAEKKGPELLDGLIKSISARLEVEAKNA